ncbi:MAG: tRNA (adenosine(37)-N6)-threonylcarbamoyltransferase complex ATPase subunit type 1 TsaE [Planctomycetota bacterium]
MTDGAPLEFVSAGPEQTVALGRHLGALARPGDVIALDGELGAGKTQLVRGLAEGLGLDASHVSSPTFVLMHEYLPPDSADADTPPLLHLDAYRLAGPDDLATLGYDHALRDASVTVVEWAERFPDPDAHLGDHRLRMLIEHRSETQRRLTLTPRGRWSNRATQLRAFTFADSTPP